MTEPALEVRELSPRGVGAVAVLRVRGPRALERLVQLTQSKVRLAPLVPGALALVRLCDRGEFIDEALVHVLTETEFELDLHGSPALVERVAELFGGRTPVRAPSSLEERAEHLLASARSESGARILLDQAEGALRRAFERLLSADADQARAALAELNASSRAARRAIEATRVVLAGPVNAGKSTLFNCWIGERRAIESREPGTTRDLVEQRAFVGVYPIDLVDTAGERELESSGAEIERAGQELARRARAEADWVLWLATIESLDGPPELAPVAARSTRAELPLDASRTTVALGRADLAGLELRRRFALALAPAVDPSGALAALEREFHRRFELPREPWRRGQGAAFDADSFAALEQLSLARNLAERRRIVELALQAPRSR